MRVESIEDRLRRLAAHQPAAGEIVDLRPAPADGFCQCGCGEPAPRITKSEPKRGYVIGEFRRFRVGHCTSARVDYRFLVSETGCWEWLGKTHRGYAFWKDTTAHRYVYTVVVGPVPKELELDHLCCVPRCINPNHLEPVTPMENTHRSRATKLSTEDVLAIVTSTARTTDLARQYGVAKTYISSVRNGHERTEWRVAAGKAGITQ